MRFRQAGLHLTMFSMACIPLNAQGPIQAVPGDRVRVTAPSLAAKPVVGWVDAVGPTTMTLVIRGNSVTVVPLRAVDRLELSVQRWSRSARVKHAAGIGFGVGALAGLIVGLVTTEPCTEQMCFRGIEILGYSALGGLALYGLGAIIGAAQPTDKWQTVDLWKVTPSVPENSDRNGQR